MSSPQNREEALFQAAVLLTGAERATFLTSACQGDAALRVRLDALLAAHDEPDELPSKANRPVQTIKLDMSDAPDEAVGQTLGRYKLLERLGEGGCGVVYVAEQTEPVRRRVALKVIKLGMDTKAVVARLEAERQALAMMDHPNIAKVLDAGTTETGRPFFVMELVRGIRITDYCDQNNLPTKERLDLFIKICQAIQHAHQKGIIHRDIKPSNILVTLHDGVPVPKVIDFGIAKATEGRLTDNTVYTQLHQFIGTPAYMSPEQAEMSGLDIDTRSDIYSLGVLLYELLAGSTPFDANELMASGIDAMRKTIREKEPVRPSTRFATLKGDQLTTTAKRRSTDKAKLVHQLKGDLDWIVMKCLEKDRTRRYDTANGLAFDLKRHLNNEPVLARPPSAAYKFQKAFRRNKVAFTAGVTVAIALLLGIIISTWQSVRATRAQREAVSARQEAEASESKAIAAKANEAKSRQQAEANAQKAESEAARSASVARFMKDMLKGVGPSAARGRDTTLLREILDGTARRVNADLTNQPAVAADLCETLGMVYSDIGNFTNAYAMLQKALDIQLQLHGEKDLQVASVLTKLGLVLHRGRRLSESVAVSRQALAIQEALLGHTNLDVAASLDSIATGLRAENQSLDEAEAKARDCLALRRELLPPQHPQIASALINLGLVLGNEGKLDEAEQCEREALKIFMETLPPDDPTIATSEAELATTFVSEGKPAEGKAMLVEALKIQRKVLGDHPDTATTLTHLGSLMVTEGRPSEAEECFTEALTIQKKLSSDTPAVLPKLIDVLLHEDKLDEARVLQKQVQDDKLAKAAPHTTTPAVTAQNAEAEALLEKLLAQPDTIDESTVLAVTLETSAKSLMAQKKPAEAEVDFRKALTLQKKRLNAVNPVVIHLQLSLIDALATQGKWAEAEQCYRDLFASQQKPLSELDSQFVTPIINYANLLERNKKPAEAEQAYRDAIAQRKRLFGTDTSNVDGPLLALGTLLWKQGDLADAEAQLRESLALIRTPPMNARSLSMLPGALAALAGVLEEEKKFTEAETLAREDLAIREPEGNNVPASWKARNLLADILITAKKVDAADQLLTSSWQKFQQAGGNIPGDDKRALINWMQKLADLYTAAGQAEKAAEWMKKLSTSTAPASS